MLETKFMPSCLLGDHFLIELHYPPQYFNHSLLPMNSVFKISIDELETSEGRDQLANEFCSIILKISS